MVFLDLVFQCFMRPLILPKFCVSSFCYSYCLYFTYSVSSNRHEKANSLLFSCTYGICYYGRFFFNQQGLDGAVFQMISHGFISAGLFLVVGVVYERTSSRDISSFGGLINNMPSYAFVFMIFTLGNIGLPGTSGFVGEFLTLIGLFKENAIYAALATLGVILSACYALFLYKRIMFGDLIKESIKRISDLSLREKVLFISFCYLDNFSGFLPLNSA